MIKEINNNILILLGGAHPTALPVHTLEECQDFDAIILREGEETVAEIYQRLQKGYGEDDIFQDVQGVVWRNPKGDIIQNEERPMITDLDALPFPDLSLAKYHLYRRVYNPNKYNGLLTLLST